MHYKRSEDLRGGEKGESGDGSSGIGGLSKTSTRMRCGSVKTTDLQERLAFEETISGSMRPLIRARLRLRHSEAH